MCYNQFIIKKLKKFKINLKYVTKKCMQKIQFNQSNNQYIKPFPIMNMKNYSKKLLKINQLVR